MDDVFLDTSWVLYSVSINSSSFRNIFASTLSLAQSQKYAELLSRYLTAHTAQYTEDVDDEIDKLGTLRECKWTHLTVSQPDTNVVLVQLVYQKQTYKFVLYSPYLILIKASPSHSKRMLDFLTETFGISAESFKLPPSILSEVLAEYITNITSPFTTTSISIDDEDGNNNLNRLAILKATVSNLKIQIAFSTSSSVAPHLKTLDLDVPYESVESLLSLPIPTQTNQSNTNTNTNESFRSQPIEAGLVFLSNLRHYITEQTGLIIPLLSSTTTSSYSSPSSTPLRVSRITSTAFAISTEGKLKFSARAIENALEQEEVVHNANLGMLASVEREARRQGAGSDD